MKTIAEIKEWIHQLNQDTHVKITRNGLSESSFWHYDEITGTVHNLNHSFFSVAGIRGNILGCDIEQPILLQDEIGYLGILCQKKDDEIYYLMQAKIEPGNINCVQISPTIQATKSNFTQKHGGAKPLYLDYFLEVKPENIIVDQIQSEQSSRFYKKRNRNMMIMVDETVDVDHRFCWMTLSQIKALMKEKNLVNMDTRTVLSCLPYIDEQYAPRITRKDFYNSVHNRHYIKEIISIYHGINNYKMFHDDHLELVRLDQLETWKIDDQGMSCLHDYPYEVIYCDIEIEGREVKNWTQPLFKANGIATFGLITTVIDSQLKFLVKIRPEIGCFDQLEIGPTLQKEAGEDMEDEIEIYFMNKVKANEDIVFDSILSEEGGRFYHEENRNIVLEVPSSSLPDLPEYYYLLSYAALNHLNLVNNCLNIQLRNLLSTLEV